jgi:uncharacterized protein (DUF1778 family)
MSDRKDNPATIQMVDDFRILAERAHAVGCRGGGVAHNAYMVDLMRAGDRHMRMEPLTLEDIVDGIWWTRWKDTGECQAVLVGYPGYGDSKVVKEFGGELFETLATRLTIDRRELIAGAAAVAVAASMPAVAEAAVGIPDPAVERLRQFLHQLFDLMRSDDFALVSLNDGGKVLFWLQDRSNMASMQMMSLNNDPNPEFVDTLDRAAAVEPALRNLS